jgi:hypothetical protein
VTTAVAGAPVRIPGGLPEQTDRAGGGLTLEQRLDAAWRGLRAGGEAECPVCSGRMTRGEDGGGCHRCGCTLF